MKNTYFATFSKSFLLICKVNALVPSYVNIQLLKLSSKTLGHNHKLTEQQACDV